MRDWVLWFDEAGQYGLIDGKAPGKTPSLNEHRSKALTDIVERGAYPFADWVVHLRLVDLQTWILEEFGITVSETLISRWLNLLSFCKPTAPPPPRQRAHDGNELAEQYSSSLRSAANQVSGLSGSKKTRWRVLPKSADGAEK